MTLLFMKRTSKQEREEIVKLYKEGISVNKLSELFGNSKCSVRALLNRRGVDLRPNMWNAARKHKIDHNYFKLINSESKAYFLGLLYADGCNYPKNNTTSIALADKDERILKIFTDQVYIEGKPLTRKKSKNPNHSDQVILNICSGEICRDLVKLGCVPAKSLVLKFPTEDQVPNNLLRHFVRGYFDGDGGIHYNKSNLNLMISITSTLEFCTRLKEIFKKELDMNFSFYKRHKDEKDNWTINCGGNYQCMKFFEWLYFPSSIFLERKYDTFVKFIKNYKITSKPQSQFQRVYDIINKYKSLEEIS